MTSDPSSIYQPKILAALYVLFDTNALSQIYTFLLHAICRPNSKMDQCSSCMLLQMCYLHSHLLLPAEKNPIAFTPEYLVQNTSISDCGVLFSLMVDNCCAPAQPLMAQLQNMMSGKAVIEPFIP